MPVAAGKVAWQGTILSIQPRIRLLRSFDKRSHSYLGYVLRIGGAIGGRKDEFSVAVGQAAHVRHALRVGDSLSGASQPVADARLEVAEFYKTSDLRVLGRGSTTKVAPPPFLGVPPDLPTYRARGHRRLDSRTCEIKCIRCIWGCRMPVEMIVDQWKPSNKRYRFETFCYGPKACMFYRAGPVRKVPGRKGMVWVEEDWVDEEATAHREEDE